MRSVSLDKTQLPGDLARFEREADDVERVAIAGLKVAPEALNAREREFARALQRHARGVKAAAAAWRQEIAHVT